MDDVTSQAGWRQVRASLLARAGEYGPVQSLAREAVETMEGTDDISSQGDTWITLARILRASGDVSGAIDAVEEAVDRYERKGNVVAAGRARDLLAELRSGPPAG